MQFKVVQLTLESNGVKVIKDNLLHHLVHLLLFPQDDIPLPLNRRSLELTPRQDIGNDLDRLSYVLPEALGVVHRLFPRRVRIQVRSQVLNLQLESMLSTLVRSLERHVFEKVGRSVRRGRLGTRSCVDPDSDRSGRRVRVRLGRDGQSIREGRDLGDGGGGDGGEGAEGSRLRGEGASSKSAFVPSVGPSGLIPHPFPILLLERCDSPATSPRHAQHE